ncbi:MAG: DUF2283 domain-containing protein [Armatimonadota bacterium]|nr:DUF2283 domain-containing protein [Armatimonadota bacterium]MDR7452725.1 DUF2283 domain-containing protein [Armatimonadota bacterium]MDR7467626.1 DUF2283 domain-containing protein [Armatimonadota bacterium]MDR7494413.1 DUF2283 domain-containing protein [Armatimonadota bacterium]MDR7500442.1 DUF2283 domain-containing protein [Armatimonadota bacterium]
MRLAYDAQADALSLTFREGTVRSSREIARSVIVNLDPAGEPVAIEILNARRWIGRRGLSRIAIDLQDLWPAE